MGSQRMYACIDLKSFYASVECVERGLDPLNTNLVVADSARTEKTICLAISPSLKSYGLPGRERLFIVNKKVKEINYQRKKKTANFKFTGKSFFASELNNNPNLELDFIIAPPQMAHYINVSSKIYQVYLKYIAKEDIHVYSIDEVFIDLTQYLKTYNITADELVKKIILDIYQTTGITATGGIGTNLYLAKVSMDIVAKHIPLDKDGVRIAKLDEMSYRKLLWSHRPLTDFWRVGHGYKNRLESIGLYTMGDIARCSLGSNQDKYNEDLLYKIFGINAELLIDHAWGYEPCTIEHIKKYQPQSSSISSGQVLPSGYTFEKAKIVVKEMIEMLVLSLVEKHLVTNQVALAIGFDTINLTNDNIKSKYQGPVTKDYFGRVTPKFAHGSVNLGQYCASTKLITDKLIDLYHDIVNPNLLIRRINVTAINVVDETNAFLSPKYEQLNLFSNYEERKELENKQKELLEKEMKAQETIIAIKKKFGKNSILKGRDLEDGATAKERNNQIGGHKA